MADGIGSPASERQTTDISGSIQVTAAEIPNHERPTGANYPRARRPPSVPTRTRCGSRRADPCVPGQLISLFISLFEQGAIAEEIALRYEVLNLQDIHATLSCFVDHRQELQE